METLLVLPKFDTYEHASIKERERYKIFVYDQLDAINSSGVRVKCFIEDEMAVDLLGMNPSIDWISCLGDADRFLFSRVTTTDGLLVQDLYNKRKHIAILNDIVSASIKKVPFPKEYLKLEAEAQKNAKMSFMLQRIRRASSAYIATVSNVIYLYNGNNYCRIPDNGDSVNGFLRYISDFKSGVESYTYGGLEIDRPFFLQIIKMGGSNK